MSGFCLGVAFSAIQAMIPVTSITLAWTHSVEHIRWEEDYAIRAGKLVITAARVQGNGAGMEPEANAARNVEISHAHTMMSEPKWGLSRRLPSNWKPMLKIPSTTTTA